MDAGGGEGKGTGSQICNLLFNEPLPIQEEVQEEVIRILGCLKQRLEDKSHTSLEAGRMIKTLGTALTQKPERRTIVGVLGSTGAGKSALINALLDHEHLTPTNCMRACTSTITEFHWNEDPSVAPYKAEIQFISKIVWENELKLFFKNLRNVTRIEDLDSTSADASITFAKICAVYPHVTKSNIKKTFVSQLLAHDNIKILAKGPHRITDSDPESFFKKVQIFIDSKHLSVRKNDGNSEQLCSTPNYWPLISKVVIHVCAPILNTGMVLVDLPGFQDNNPARAKIADDHHRTCDELLIVSPIRRATDETLANGLLNETTRHQLFLDDRVSRVTFVCSMVDEVIVSEVVDELAMHDEMALFENSIQEANDRLEMLSKELSELNQSNAQVLEQIQTLSQRVACKNPLAAWASSGLFKSKRLRVDGGEDETLSVKMVADAWDDVGKRLELLQTRIGTVHDEMKFYKKQKRDAKAGKRRLGILSRNAACRDKIKTHLAQNFQEIYDEIEEGADAQGFTSSTPARDPQELGNDLPVFCISSRAYQKLSGRAKDEEEAIGFSNHDDTEIPQLRAHCIERTISRRQNACVESFRAFDSVMNSLRLRSFEYEALQQLEEMEKASRNRKFRTETSTMKNALGNLVQQRYSDLCDVFRRYIYNCLERAKRKGIANAKKSVMEWTRYDEVGNPSKTRPEDIKWNTFRSICERSGDFDSSNGNKHHWNAELAQPVLDTLASGWIESFVTQTRRLLSRFEEEARNVLENFHENAVKQAQDTGRHVPRALLDAQMVMYLNMIVEQTQRAAAFLKDEQQKLNREFEAQIRHNMTASYEFCADQFGTGCFGRMRDKIYRHVTVNRVDMFTKTVTAVQQKLGTLAQDFRQRIHDGMRDLESRIVSDYTSALTPRPSQGSARHSASDEEFLAKIPEIIADANKMIKAALKQAQSDVDSTLERESDTE